MNYSDGFRYVCFRLLLLVGADALAVVLGKGMLWVLSSVVPANMGGLKEFLIDDRTGSVTAAIVMVIALGVVFRDDGKKHAAYDDWDVTLAVITAMLMMVFYFIPVIFYNPADITRVMQTVYYIVYFPCRWAELALGLDIKAAVALGIGAVLAVQLALYISSYSGYKRKHPFSFKPAEENRTETENE